MLGEYDPDAVGGVAPEQRKYIPHPRQEIDLDAAKRRWDVLVDQARFKRFGGADLAPGQSRPYRRSSIIA